MSRWNVKIVWLLFAAVAYMQLHDVIRPWIDLPTPGNIGFTVVFVLFSITHCAVCEGIRRTAVFFGLSAVVSWLLEEIGVRSGLIYGPYHYSGMLGPKLGHVPVIIPLAWFMMIYPAWMVARALLRGVETRTVPGIAGLAVVAALVMTAWDTVMDPGMAAAGNWVWEQGGPYFGVPLRNYWGWLLTTFPVYVGAGLLWRGRSVGRQGGGAVSRSFAALPVASYALDALSYMSPHRLAALQVVAVFAMGTPALVAVLRTWMSDETGATAAEAEDAAAVVVST
jgi:uncharacterized membrane protein